MGSFAYQAIDSDGRAVSGTVTAGSPDAAKAAVRDLGRTPIEVVEAAAVKLASSSRPSIPAGDVAALMRELATGIEAGLPLMQSLVTVRRQSASQKQAVILDFLIERVEAGRPLHEACREYGAPFDDMIVGMIRAADASGRMHEVLHQLADLLERSLELRRELIGATIYPLIVLFIMGVSVAIFVTAASCCSGFQSSGTFS